MLTVFSTILLSMSQYCSILICCIHIMDIFYVHLHSEAFRCSMLGIFETFSL
jgi:hypothetical protein